jgi:hypothetical protein
MRRRAQGREARQGQPAGVKQVTRGPRISAFRRMRPGCGRAQLEPAPTA